MPDTELPSPVPTAPPVDPSTSAADCESRLPLQEAVDSPDRLARAYLKAHPAGALRFWRGEFFGYRYGPFVPLGDHELKAKLHAFIHNEFVRDHQFTLELIRRCREEPMPTEKPAKRGSGDGRLPEVRKVTSRLVSDVLGAVRSQTILSDAVRPPAWVDDATGPDPKNLISLQNGLLDVTTRQLLPPTASFFTTNALAFDYDPDALEPSRWLEFLDSLWQDDQAPDKYDQDSIDCLQEWFGYLISADTSLQKMLFMIGPPRSGKGTIARILKELVGGDNLAGPTLSSLTGQFGLGPLYGKSVAVISDARLSGRTDTSVIVERLLSITGEDTQTVDRKFLQQINTKLGTRIVILSNELPNLSDASGALPNRMILIRLTRSFLGREDPALTDRLIDELPGILLWALAGLNRLRQRGRFLHPPSSAELMVDMEELSSPITGFIRDRVILDPNSVTAIKDVFAEWKTWCQDHNREHPGTEQSFGRQLRSKIATLKSKQPRGSAGSRYRVYHGLRLRTVFDDTPEMTTEGCVPAGRLESDRDKVSSIEL